MSGEGQERERKDDWRAKFFDVRAYFIVSVHSGAA